MSDVFAKICYICKICFLCTILFAWFMVLYGTWMTLLHGIISHFDLCFSHSRMINGMERYNRDFNNLFNSLKPGLLVFCKWCGRRECIQKRGTRMHLKVILPTDREEKKVHCSDTPPDFENWEPKKIWARNQV